MTTSTTPTARRKPGPAPKSVPQHLVDAVIAGEMSARKAAISIGISNHTVAGAVARHLAASAAAGANDTAPPAAAAESKFVGLGYDAGRPDKTPAQAWSEHAQAFEHKLARNLRAQGHVIVRPDASAFAIYHATDVHLDDDATPLRLLEEDIRASHGMAALMVHGGDALNNWPTGGRLAAKYGDQSCTIPDAILRLQHYIDILRPDVWVDGNHEEFSSHMPFLIDRMLPSSTITGYWTCDVTVRSKGGRDLRMAVSHKFNKGSSTFHKLHGHIKEMLESQERDLLLDGHLHSSGVLEHTLPERQHTALCVASAGYKVMDSYAARISRGGIVPKLKGRAHWIVVDPQAELDGTFCAAFTDPRQAEALLNGLQNLRGGVMALASAPQVPAAYAAGAGPHPDWSPEMCEIFAAFIEDRHPIEEIAEIFGISRVSVRLRAARMARMARENNKKLED